jgi:hypothetical protein
MKNLLKFVLLSFFVSFLSSCGEAGGTIIVKNSGSAEKIVTVYSDFVPYGSVFMYKDKYGPKNIGAGGSADFVVKSDGQYGIVWNNGTVDRYRTVDVSGGNIVEYDLP